MFAGVKEMTIPILFSIEDQPACFCRSSHAGWPLIAANSTDSEFVILYSASKRVLMEQRKMQHTQVHLAESPTSTGRHFQSHKKLKDRLGFSSHIGKTPVQ